MPDPPHRITGVMAGVEIEESRCIRVLGMMNCDKVMG